MSDERTGWGGEFHLHNGSTLVELANIASIEPPEDSVDEIEVSHLKSTGRRKEYITGMIDGGNIVVEMIHVPNSASDQLCLAAKAAGDSRAWKIVFPDTDGTAQRQYTGNGIVTGYRVNALTPKDAQTSTLTIRVTGAVTEAAAS